MEIMNPGRRLFLRNLGALAALAVAPTTLAALTPDDHARLMAALRSGLVENQTFLITRPVVIDFADGLLIRNCTFVIAPSFPKGEPVIELTGKDPKATITDCLFR